MKLLHIGFSNIVSMDKVVAIIAPDSMVAKRIRDNAKKNDSLIDCTMGRKTRSMVLTDSPYTFLSTIRPEALLQRLQKDPSGLSSGASAESSSEEEEAEVDDAV